MSVFKAHIDSMSSYRPPLEGRNPDQFTLLDFNERTLPIDDDIVEEIISWLKSGRLHMYPAYGNIDARIADYCGVSAANVMITNGSDQGLDLVFRAACTPGCEVIIPAPSFPIYLQSAQVEQCVIHEPHYRRETGYPFAEVQALINRNTRVIVVANPNNPSGTAVSAESIIGLAKAAPHAIILVDECYYEYCQITVADCVESYPNIVVTRTFSKTWGLPSLRLGYVLAAADNIQALLKVRGPYDVNQLAVVAARAALNRTDLTRAYVAEVMTQSKPLFEQFLMDSGIDFWPSSANFILAAVPNADAVEKSLRAQGILVRPKADADGNHALRITLGSLVQTEALIKAMQVAMNQADY